MGDFIEEKKQEVDKKEKEIINKPTPSINTPEGLLLARLTKEATELLSTEIQNKYVIYTTRSDERSECWIYEKGIFKPDARTYIKEYIRNEINNYYSPEIVSKVIAKIEADTYIEQDEFFSKQNQHPYLMPVENGVLNIDTKELLPHSPKYCFFNKLPVIYDPTKKCENIIKFLSEVLKNNEDIETLQEFYGSCLLKEYRYEKSLLVVGTGRNGKGKTLELLKYLLGADNCTEISPQTLEEDLFAMGELVNKLANISGDINNKALSDTGVFKSLTGRDLMTGARKFKTRVKFINYAKFIFSTNEVPITYDLSDGFFSRWIIIDFPYRFLDPEDINEVPENERELIKLKDPEIINKLITPEEISGFLNWTLEGYTRLKKTKRFTNGQTIAKVKQMWIRKSSSIQAFIMDCITEDYEGMISKQEFKEKYIGYCRRHKIRAMSDKVIFNVLTTSMSVSEVQPFNNGEDRIRYWKGIKFRNNFGVESD